MKILSYNINYLPWKNKKYDKFFDVVNEFDIIFLQEAFFNINPYNGKNYISRKLEQYKYNIAKSNFPEKFYIIDSGLLIASKYNILSSKFYPFYIHSSTDSLAEKGFLHCVIDTSKIMIHIINTHLQSSYTDEWPYTGLHSRERIRQLLKLYNFVSKLNGNIIICGDFNLSTPKENYMFSKLFKNFNIIQNKYDAILTNMDMNEYKKHIHKVRNWSDHEPISSEIN